jgi:hypothetical protein
MAIFTSYVKLPEGTWGFPEMEKTIAGWLRKFRKLRS